MYDVAAAAVFGCRLEYEKKSRAKAVPLLNTPSLPRSTNLSLLPLSDQPTAAQPANAQLFVVIVRCKSPYLAEHRLSCDESQ